MTNFIKKGCRVEGRCAAIAQWIRPRGFESQAHHLGFHNL